MSIPNNTGSTSGRNASNKWLWPLVVIVVIVGLFLTARLTIKNAVDAKMAETKAAKRNPDLPPAPDIAGAAHQLKQKFDAEKQDDQQKGRRYRLLFDAYVLADDAGDTPLQNRSFEPFKNEITLSDPEQPITPAIAQTALTQMLGGLDTWQSNLSQDARGKVRYEIQVKSPLDASGNYTGKDFLKTRMPSQELSKYRPFLDALAAAAGDEAKLAKAISDEQIAEQTGGSK